MIDDTLAIILAGGEGARLQPLTSSRTKPSVPFGGKYRIIDFTLSNCLHSGLRRVLVLTQYKSHSLQKHLRNGWSIFNPELGEYITPVPAQRRRGDSWYQGTADAVYQNNYLLERSDAEWTLILSGDHVYRMDYAAMLQTHKSSNAAVTIACMAVPIDEATQFGVVETDDCGGIIGFQEKPASPAPSKANPEQALVSMGIYLFSTHLLLKRLEQDSLDPNSSHDFGKDILPKMVAENAVQAHYFGGDTGRVTQDRYWRDVGSIGAYYQANMDLLEPVPPLDIYQADWSIRSYQPQSPPARAVPGSQGNEGIFINSILCDGTIIAGGNVAHSVLSQDVYIGDRAMVEDSVLFAGVRVGKNARLIRCIVDKGIDIPAGEAIGYDIKRDRERFVVTEDGIVVVPKGFQFEQNQAAHQGQAA